MKKTDFSLRLGVLILLGLVGFGLAQVWAAPKGTNVSIDTRDLKDLPVDDKNPPKNKQLSGHRDEPYAVDFDENGEVNPHPYMQF